MNIKSFYDQCKQSSIILLLCCVSGTILGAMIGLYYGVADVSPSNDVIKLFVSNSSDFFQKRLTTLCWISGSLSLFFSYIYLIRSYSLFLIDKNESYVIGVRFFFVCLVMFVLIFATENSIKEWGIVHTWNLLPIDFILQPQRPLLFFVGCCCLFFLFWLENSFSKKLTSLSNIISIVWIMIASGYAWRLSMVEMPLIIGSSLSENHTVPLTFPIFRASSGSYVYQGVWSQYGGFAQWISVIFHFGNSEEKLQWGMFVSLWVAISSLFYVIKKASGSAVAAFVGMMSCMWIAGATERSYLIYQGMHLRWIFPCILLAVASMDSNKKAIRWGWILIPWAIHWNPETGLACFATWSIVSVCHFIGNFYHTDSRKELRWDVIEVVGCFVISCAFLMALFWIGSGDLPDLRKTYYFMSIFGAAGFMGLHSSLLHWWWLPVITSILGLNASLSFKGENSTKLLLSVAAWLQIFLLPYFLGRSAYTNLMSLVYPSVVIASVLAMNVLNEKDLKKKKKIYIGSSWIAGVSTLLFFCICTSIMITSDINGPEKSTDISERKAFEDKIAVVQFIKSTVWDSTFEHVAFIAPQSGLILETLGLKKYSKLPSTPLSGVMLRSQANEWLDYARNADEVYFDPTFVQGGSKDAYPWHTMMLAMMQNNFYFIERMDLRDPLHPLIHLVSQKQKEKLQKAITSRK